MTKQYKALSMIEQVELQNKVKDMKINARAIIIAGALIALSNFIGDLISTWSYMRAYDTPTCEEVGPSGSVQEEKLYIAV